MAWAIAKNRAMGNRGPPENNAVKSSQAGMKSKSIANGINRRTKRDWFSLRYQLKTCPDAVTASKITARVTSPPSQARANR